LFKNINQNKVDRKERKRKNKLNNTSIEIIERSAKISPI